MIDCRLGRNIINYIILFFEYFINIRVIESGRHRSQFIFEAKGIFTIESERTLSDIFHNTERFQ